MIFTTRKDQEMRPYVLKFVLTLIEATLEGAPALLHSSLCCAHLSASRRASDSAGRTPWYLAAQPDFQPPFSFSVSAAPGPFKLRRDLFRRHRRDRLRLAWGCRRISLRRTTGPETLRVSLRAWSAGRRVNRRGSVSSLVQQTPEQ